MKVELTTYYDESDEKTYAVGWTMVAETDEEKSIVNRIRNLNFWGAPRYNGRRGGNDTNDAGMLMWVDEEFKSTKFQFNPDKNSIEPSNEDGGLL